MSVRRIPEFHDRAPDLDLQKLDKVVKTIEAFVLDPNDRCAVQTRSATAGPGKFTAKELHTEKADGAMETPASYIGSADPRVKAVSIACYMSTLETDYNFVYGGQYDGEQTWPVT